MPSAFSQITHVNFAKQENFYQNNPRNDNENGKAKIPERERGISKLKIT